MNSTIYGLTALFRNDACNCGHKRNIQTDAVQVQCVYQFFIEVNDFCLSQAKRSFIPANENTVCNGIGFDGALFFANCSNRLKIPNNNNWIITWQIHIEYNI